MNDKSKITRALFRFVVLPIIVIACADIIFLVTIFFLIYFQKIESVSFEVIAESTMLSTGISLIGIAISVWAGLNIINAISRKDIDLAEKKVEELKRIEDSFYVFEKDKFVSELLNSIKDLPTKELSDIIIDMDYTVMKNCVSDLIYIEQLFGKTLYLHNLDYAEDIRANTIEKGLKQTELLLNENRRVIDVRLFNYIKYRRAEFLYYKGYCESGESAITCFLCAIDLYKEAIPLLFGISIPDFEDFETVDKIFTKRCTSANILLSAYFCNTIGDAYSKITQYKSRIKKELSSDIAKKIEYSGKKSQFYCRYAVDWNENHYEVYYRNFGVSIERSNAHVLNDKEKALFLYLRKQYQLGFEYALDNPEASPKSVYAWLSLSKKYNDEKLNLKKIALKNPYNGKISNI